MNWYSPVPAKWKRRMKPSGQQYWPGQCATFVFPS